VSAQQSAEAPCAVGRLTPQGPWIGFQPAASGYRFVIGLNGALRSAEADGDLLLALAIAYFTEAFEGAPPEMEATQADLSELITDLARRETDSEARRLLREVLDAIDDGLAGDAVAGRLAAARPARTEPIDPIELLRTRAMELAATA
jgi:plasmid stabilization system protein ParE